VDSVKLLQELKSFQGSSSDETIRSYVNLERTKSDSEYESIREKELQVVKYSGPPQKAHKVKLEEMNFVLDCTCEVIEEVFHLSAPTNWLRNQGLYLVKTLIRNTYGSVISDMIQKNVESILNEENICLYLDTIREYIWPIEDLSDPTNEEKNLAKTNAWNLLMQENTPRETTLGIGIDRIQKIVGKYNTIIGLTRLFNMLQHEELNRILMFSFLQVLVEQSCTL
jgi:hypothetical protein